MKIIKYLSCVLSLSLTWNCLALATDEGSAALTDISEFSDSIDLFGGGHGGGDHGGGGHGGGDHGGGGHGGGWGGGHDGDHHGGGWGHPGWGHPGWGHPGWGYPHWGHPYFPRPSYGYDWGRLRVVTCTAEDRFGNLYPVTEDRYFGDEYKGRMEEIEDEALNRCYEESHQDSSCRLLGCNPGY